MTTYNSIFKKLNSCQIPERFCNISNYQRTDCDYVLKNTNVQLFGKKWKIIHVFNREFTVSHFSLNDTVTYRINFTYNYFEVIRHSSIFNSRRNMTIEYKHVAKSILQWLLYFYYARY